MPKRILPLCKRCGKEFNSENTIFCSRSCYDSERTEIINSRDMPCKNCGINMSKPSISSDRAFCSMKCRSEKARAGAHISCSWCKIEFTPIKWRRGASIGFVIDKSMSCCSKECRINIYKYCEKRKAKISASEKGNLHHRWAGGGKRRGFRGHGWLEIAESCRNAAGRRCEHCGKSEEENGRKLDVNHKIPFFQWKKNSMANKPGNLEALCRGCHTKADAKWKRENPVQLDLCGMFA